MFSEIGMYYTKVDICNNFLLYILRMHIVLRSNQMIFKLVLQFKDLRNPNVCSLFFLFALSLNWVVKLTAQIHALQWVFKPFIQIRMLRWLTSLLYFLQIIQI